jgi:CRISPR-associated exonuclease Cas4
MPPRDTSTDSETGNGPSETPVETLADTISNTEFTEWYDERQIKQNLLNGNPYFNGPSPAKPPTRHTPSQLLQCHRKATYTRQNAPREGTVPDGIFWIGSAFEEEIIVPYLQDATPNGLYIQNSIWVDTTVSTEAGDVRIRGATDPVIVTADGTPVLPTEIKTTSSIEHLSSPKPHHKAQLHAYLYALNTDTDHDVATGLVIYGSRKTFDLEVFTVAFDPEFWNRVVTWMGTQTEYEQQGELPPADPERDWECEYCSFKHRCGEGTTPYSDIGVTGLLPLFDDYGEENLTEYLDAREGTGAKLTPTLAHAYPDLVQEYDAYPWSCSRCGTTYAWDSVDWDGNTDDPPLCPSCLSAGDLVALSGPEPHEQETAPEN